MHLKYVVSSDICYLFYGFLANMFDLFFFFAQLLICLILVMCDFLDVDVELCGVLFS